MLSRSLSGVGRSPRAAVTLVEALVATALTVMIGSSVLLSLSTAIDSAEMGREQTIAGGLAEQLLDEIAGRRYHALDASPLQWPLGPAGNEGPHRATFDDLDDFDRWASGAVNPHGIAYGQDGSQGSPRPAAFRCQPHWLSSWRLAVDVYYVSEANPSQRLAAGQTSNLRAVQVRVLADRPGGGVHTLADLRRVFAYVPPSP
jgi:type II secretory pathway pseudopilin PulG